MITLLPRTVDPTQCNTKRADPDRRTFTCVDYPNHAGDHAWFIDTERLIDPDCPEDCDGWHWILGTDRLCVHDPDGFAAACAARIGARQEQIAIANRRHPPAVQEALF